MAKPFVKFSFQDVINDFLVMKTAQWEMSELSTHIYHIGMLLCTDTPRVLFFI